MIWEIDPKANSRLNDIAKAMKGADRLILSPTPIARVRPSPGTCSK